MQLQFSICIIIPILSSFPSNSWAQDAPVRNLPAPRAYVEQVLDTMQKNALHKGKIDWNAVRKETLARSRDAKTTIDTYPAIAYALSQLQERHSFLQLPDRIPDGQKETMYEQMYKSLVLPRLDQKKSPFAPSKEIQGRMLHRASESFAYVVIPMCSSQYAEGKNTALFQEFADKLHEIVIELHAEQPTGWIIDLRGNGGGDMWPMLAGIGAVLGEGQLGAFVSADGTRTSWQYKDGKAGMPGITKAEIRQTPFVLPELPPVAVLFDGGTASSGEAIAISFAGRPRERSFGEHTAGLSTANQPYPLPDGAVLVLCVATEADRTGRVYSDGLDPDVAVLEPGLRPSSEDQDAAIRAAEEWLATSRAVPKNASPRESSHER